MADMAGTGIYTVTYSAFSVGGTQFDVQKVTVTTVVNSVPNIVVAAAATPDLTEGVSVRNTGILEYAGLLSEYSALASAGGTKCQLKLTVADASSGDSQTIEVKDWILTNVGLSDGSPHAPCMLSFTIKHPACITGMLGGVYGNYDSKMTGLYTGDVKDFVGAMASACRFLSETIRTSSPESPSSDVKPPAVGLSEVDDRISTAMSRMAGHVEGNIEWSVNLPGNEGAYSTGVPFGSGAYADADMSYGMKRRMALDCLSCSTSSPLAVLTQYICPVYGLSLVPTWWKKLTLMPYSPYANASASIDSSRIARMSHPSNDPAPLYGVRMSVGGNSAFSTVTFFSQSKAKDDVHMPKEIAYIPSAGAERLGGRMLSLSKPPFMDSVLTIAAGHGTVESTSAVSYSAGKQAAVSRTGLGLSIEACQAYAAHVFISKFREGCESSFTMPLSVSVPGSSVPGGLLIPGIVVSVSADGETVYEGYATHVVHVVDCGSSSAYTSVRLTHTRGAGGYAPVIEGAVYNPLYI